ncbi:hypothetical protein R5R35_011699 [Gryllus longicercus]|uniref:Uncharacterized protein n=1 Tax=Gryllus longicercus TaxID=2509291 RepID=A0AAN9VWC2_9ORTH
MTRCGQQFNMSASQGNMMVFYDSAEEEVYQQQDDDVYDDEEHSQDEEEEEIETCNIPAYVATKEYVNERLEYASQLSSQDADIALQQQVNQLKATLQSVTDTQSRCLRQWNVNDAFNADLYRISNTASPQDEKDVTNKAYVDRNIKNIKTHVEKIPKLRCSKLGNVNVMEKRLVNMAPPIKKEDCATKGYVDEKIKREIPKYLAGKQT